ncbi:hypothetical protein [Paludisphaera mucosa]|uniref:SH3b domain-containing protein n=1 Tax=Paludisphaera mucosa TaxID=3030827 RepID=A0ABT6FAR6_9BACT|nr:hypothetical protein [Paludisphaera mucosa]MDG3004655.1 hypothetical protein [Paludisphaera mucosa]
MILAHLLVLAVLGQSDAVEARVTAERLEVLDEAGESGYVVAALKRGDAVRVRPSENPRHGWLAIEPPASVLCWVEESALKMAEGEDGSVPRIAKVRSTTAVRSGNPRAKLPGPPRGSLKPGDRVRLADRPALESGSKSPQRWRAIAPPPGRAFFVAADGVAWDAATSPPSPPAEVQTSFTTAGDDPELRRADGMLLAETTGQPVEKWRLGAIREAYEARMKQADGDPEKRRTLEARLAQVARYERASKAAQGFVEAASRTRELDSDFARIERKLADAERERSRAYDAVGFIQPSAKMLDGRKLFALIGREGTVVAYLDVPAGLDPQPLTARRVGVRGQSRYNAELKARLIAVRDLVNLEPKG